MAIPLPNFVSEFLAANSTPNYVSFFITLVVLFIVFRIFDSSIVYFLKRIASKTKNNWDDFVIDFIEGFPWTFFAYLSIYLASFNLNTTPGMDKVLNFLLLIFLAYYISRAVINVSNHFFDRYKEIRIKKGQSSNESMIGVLKIIFSIVIWSVALLMLLSNLGIEITPLIAGLGVGGIAVGLALQSVLADLFAAFAIYFDKPFEEGDFVIVGSDMGVIKHIGIKSTRIQALGGQELVMSNSELTNSRINNYKKMNSRRVVFEFGVEYGTSTKQLKKIKEIVSKIIDKEERTKLDRVHFKNFGDSSLNFECVYYIDTNDYNIYMDVQEKINLAIKEKVEGMGVDFAFPSRTIYFRKD